MVQEAAPTNDDIEYVPECLLGAGAWSLVYRGEVIKNGVRQGSCAIKAPRFLDAEKFLLYEADVYRRLPSHPNLVGLIAADTTQGEFRLVIELVEGGIPPDTYMKRGRPSSLARTLRALEVAAQLCDALTAMHGADLLHRDIKPENTLVVVGHDETALVRLLDYGLACSLEEASHPRATVQGTAAYVSPEQARGYPLDARSDLFSVGNILYELLTERMLLIGETEAELVIAAFQLRIEEREELHDLDTRVRALLIRLLAHYPSQRPRSAMMAAQEIRAVMAELQQPLSRGPRLLARVAIPAVPATPSAPSPSPSPRAQPASRAPVSAFSWATLGLLMGILGATAFFGGLLFPQTQVAPQTPTQARVTPHSAPETPSTSIDIRAEAPRHEEPVQCWARDRRHRHLPSVLIGDRMVPVDQACWQRIARKTRERDCRHLIRRNLGDPLFHNYCDGFLGERRR